MPFRLRMAYFQCPKTVMESSLHRKQSRYGTASLQSTRSFINLIVILVAKSSRVESRRHPLSCLSACLSVCLHTCLPVCLSACLPACLSDCQSVSIYCTCIVCPPLDPLVRLRFLFVGPFVQSVQMSLASFSLIAETVHFYKDVQKFPHSFSA